MQSRLTRKHATEIARKFVSYIDAHEGQQWTPDLLISFLPYDLREKAATRIEQSDCHPCNIGDIASTIYRACR